MSRRLQKSGREMPPLWGSHPAALGECGQTGDRPACEGSVDLSLSLYAVRQDVSRLPARDQRSGSKRSDALTVCADLEDRSEFASDDGADRHLAGDSVPHDGLARHPMVRAAPSEQSQGAGGSY